MVKIWAKVVKDDKITKDIIFEKDEKFSIVNFIDYVQEISKELDIPTPVILKYHIKNFFDFNNAKFSTCDFIEAVDFDIFALEVVKQ